MISLKPRRMIFSVAGALLLAMMLLSWVHAQTPASGALVTLKRSRPVEVDRSPVDCILTPDEKWLVSANQTSGTLSLVNLKSGKVMDEVPCGNRPACVTLDPTGKKVLVSAAFSHEIIVFDLQAGKLREVQRRWVGFEPHGTVFDAAGKWVYVALTTAHAVAVLDAASLEESARIPVGKWPRSLTLTPNGKQLVVGCSGDGTVALVDVEKRQLLRLEPFQGLNQGQIAVSPDGEFIFTPYIYHFGSGPTERTIKLGWVTTSRIARIRVHTAKRVSSLYLDTQGEAVADPCGMAFSPDQKWLVCTASGTHELLLFRNEQLPYQGFSSRFLIDEDLRKDSQRYGRIPLGGRPMFVRFSRDNRHVYVANYLLNAIQVVDLQERKVSRTIALGGPAESSLARQGEALFFDGNRGFDHWYSCASCHYEGHSNGIAMDTTNDGRLGNPKMVPSLRYVTQTGPWTWHGWQKSLPAAMKKSMAESMLGKPLADQEVEALVTYLGTLEGPASPLLGPKRELSAAAKRGKEVFSGEKAGCAQCHQGEYFTDDKIHKVGLESAGDYYKGFNPPTLRGVYDRMKYLHDGRTNSLEETLRGPHAPEKLGNGKLTEAELQDLVEYLKTL
jgi:YVTN family beta-propeller protein